VLTARDNAGQIPTTYLPEVEPTEERFRAVFEAAPIGMALHVATGKVVETNRAYQAMLGYTNEELVHLGVRRVTHPDDVGEGQRLWKELLSGQRDVYVREKRYIHRQGHTVWAQATASAVRHPDGTLRYILSMVRDISAQKRAAREAQIFLELGRALNTATSAREAAQIILHAAQELLGWDAGYLHLKSLEGMIDPVMTLDTMDGRIVEVPSSCMTRQPSPLMIHVLEHGALHINRLGGNDHTSPVPLEPFGQVERPSVSMLYAPIHHGEVAVGIISVQRYTANAYGTEALSLLEGLAEHCGGALRRIQALEKVAESEVKNRTLVEALPDWILRFRADGTIVSSKAPAEFTFPKPCSDSTNVCDVIPEPAVRLLMPASERALKQGRLETFEFEAGDNGDLIVYEARVVASERGEFLALIGDITERKRLEREVLEISAAERRRIGHELHDGVGQHLAGVAFKAKLLERQLQDENSECAPGAGEVARLVNGAIRQVRFVCTGLDPVSTGTEDLPSNLAKLAQDTEAVYQLCCLFRTNCSGIELDSGTNLHLYRVAQEALNNSIRHGESRHITIELWGGTDRLHLAIQDDGKGFSPALRHADGIGLRSMKLRIGACGGILQVHSEPGTGTLIKCDVPLRR
jgi:two-component system, LuxR family, sensor kinase FixL